MLPSGDQHVLTCGDQRVVVVSVGAGLRSYRVAGVELLDGYGEDERATGARGQVLAPWPNRLADGRYRWQGLDHQLPLSEPEHSNAIHGLARWRAWRCRSQATRRVTLGLLVHPQPGYPFTLDLAVTYELDAEGLTVTTTATNLGAGPLPFALGQHPYLSGRGLVDACVVRAPGAVSLPTDERGIPTGRANVEGTELDLRAGRLLGGTRLDIAFTDLGRSADGRAEVVFEPPQGPGLRLWVDETYRYIELFTGDSLPERERRRRGLGVEPMTAPPNALATGEDVTRLDPGQSTTSRWGITTLDRAAEESG